MKKLFAVAMMVTFIVFTVLKASGTHLTTMSWFWVFSPIIAIVVLEFLDWLVYKVAMSSLRRWIRGEK